MFCDKFPPCLPRDSDVSFRVPFALLELTGASSIGRRVRVARWAAVAAGLLLAPVTTIAGDLYLRVGLGLEQPENATFTDIDCASTSPAALYGCGTGRDGAPHRSHGDFGTVPALELGLGYPNGTVRLEALVEFRPKFSFEGRANFLTAERRQSVQADLSTVSGMLAGFVDFPESGKTTPFVGVGIGAVHTRIGQMSMNFPVTTTIVPGADRVDLAWMVTAGVGIALSERTTLDLAWRYTDLGEIRTGQGEGRVVWPDGPRPLDLAPTRARLGGHGFRVSLRRTL